MRRKKNIMRRKKLHKFLMVLDPWKTSPAIVFQKINNGAPGWAFAFVLIKLLITCCKTIKFFCPSLRITPVAVLRQLDYGSRSEMQFAGGCVARIWPINERQPDSSFQQWYYSTGSLFPLMHTRIVCNGRPTSLLWPRRTS